NLDDRPTRFLQIWIKRKFKGIRPSYDQNQLDRAQLQGRLVLVVSPDGADGPVRVNADAPLHPRLSDEGDAFSQPLDTARLTYVHLAQGKLAVNGLMLKEGDGALLEGDPALKLSDGEQAEVLVFDLARA